MKVLSSNEVSDVSGAWSVEGAAAATIGLMTLAPASVAVITAGAVALAFYSAARYYNYNVGPEQPVLTQSAMKAAAAAA